jgi:uncharacterized coiled-coil DUF342 family protein
MSTPELKDLSARNQQYWDWLTEMNENIEKKKKRLVQNKRELRNLDKLIPNLNNYMSRTVQARDSFMAQHDQLVQRVNTIDN